MVEGFWIVQFEALKGSGGGVVMFTKGVVFGGDSSTTYLGTYHENDNTVKARVKIHSFIPGVASVIGIEGDYELEVTGDVKGDIVTGSGTPVGHQAAGMALRLTRVAKLPD